MLDQAVEQLAVKRVIDEYSDCVTMRDFARMATLFAEDAVWMVGPPFDMRLEGTAIAPSLGAALANYEVLLQAAMNSVIDLDGVTATARTTIYEMGRSPDGSFVQYGIYEDTLARTAGRWQFATRTFHMLYRDDSTLTGASFPF